MSYNEWLDIDVLEDYLDGKLDAKTMYKVERLSLEDPFVAEALAGLSQSPRRSQSLSLLQKQLQERIAQKPIEKKRWTITSQRLSIGAAAAVLFVTASVLFWMKDKSQPKINDNAPKNVQIKIAPDIKPSPAIKPTTPLSLDADKAIVVAKVNPKAKNNIPAVVAAKPTFAVAAAAPELSILGGEVAQAEARQESVAKAMAAEKKEQESKAVVASALASKVAGVQVDAANAKSITGRVLSQEDGLPIPGAAVRLSNGNASTITNAKGEFTLPLDSGSKTNQQLDIRYIGFLTKNVSASPNQNLNVVLEPDSKSLSEVVVTSSGVAKAKRSVAKVKSTPLPEGGWENFEQYLKTNNRLAKEAVSDKSVTLKFEIINGRPSRIIIVQGLTKAENEEAIRLVNAGPNWIVPAQVSATMQVVIKF
ncbi:carboxypeptidase-like regulatory domain-containing protein [Pedobacter sp. UC225_61]|uniref:carboxypeptidase-like regulatory domain-containing protein n=1 Tax=Pedobacter sp. UC225_61 TaxID=3374623 RepID=UPI00379182AF